MTQKLVEVFVDENSTPLTTFELLEDTQGKPLRVGGEMQLADVKNQNGRIYSEALWRRVFESAKTMGRLKERRMVGELDHPPSGKTTARQISHVMTKLDLRESKRFPGKLAVYGEYESVPGTPDGKILEALHRAKIGIAVSSRGDGDLEERGGESYVIPESYDLDTFDAVMDPSVNVQVGVLESLQKNGDACACISNKSVENLVQAIYGIVEGGDFDKSAAAYYKAILEGVNPDGSETYLMATEALRELTNHLEVTKVMKTETPTAASPTAPSITEARAGELQTENATLRIQLETATKRADAGERLCKEFMIQARGLKMQNESLAAKLADHVVVKTRYESAKEVLGKMREQVLALQGEGRLRIAAEKLLGALLTKIDEAKRGAYVEKMLLQQPVESRKALRPLLLECDNKSAVNRLVLVFKSSVTEGRGSGRRGLPPVTENGRRGKIPTESVLLESRTGKDKEVPAGTQAATPQLQEQVDLSKLIMKSMRG